MSYGLLMEGRSTEELQDYINNYQKYVPEAIEAAVAELKNRGEIFTLEEQAEIEKRINIRRQEMKEAEPLQVVNKYDEPLGAPTEPELYSQPAIFGFTFFFSIIIGAILLCINLNRLGKRREVNAVALASISYMILGTILLAGVAGNFLISMLFNAIGGIILNLFFWKRYIGDIRYTRRPIWLPLIICLAVSFTISIWLITSGAYPMPK